MALPLPSLSTSAALLPSLLLLETVLSADNALALASLVRPVETDAQRKRLLNWGLATAIVLRLGAVAAAGVVLHQPLVRLLGGGYLVWLALGHFRVECQSEELNQGHQLAGLPVEASPLGRASGEIGRVLLLALTNLAFSIDSICAALALTDNLPMVMLAGTVGIGVLRGVAGWVLGWMEHFPNLANAGYLTVLAVGLRLVVEQVMPPLAPSEPVMIGAMVAFLGWGSLQPEPAKP
jgi:YkoY family integral membrane protein